MNKSDIQVQKDVEDELSWDPKVNAALSGVSDTRASSRLRVRSILTPRSVQPRKRSSASPAFAPRQRT